MNILWCILWFYSIKNWIVLKMILQSLNKEYDPTIYTQFQKIKQIHWNQIVNPIICQFSHLYCFHILFSDYVGNFISWSNNSLSIFKHFFLKTLKFIFRFANWYEFLSMRGTFLISDKFMYLQYSVSLFSMVYINDEYISGTPSTFFQDQSKRNSNKWDVNVSMNTYPMSYSQTSRKVIFLSFFFHSNMIHVFLQRSMSTLTFEYFHQLVSVPLHDIVMRDIERNLSRMP